MHVQIKAIMSGEWLPWQHSKVSPAFCLRNGSSAAALCPGSFAYVMCCGTRTPATSVTVFLLLSFSPIFLFLNQMRPQVPRLSKRLVGLPAVRVRGPPGALRQEQRGASVRHQRPGAPEPVPPAAGGEDPGLHGPLPGEVGGASVDFLIFEHVIQKTDCQVRPSA